MKKLNLLYSLSFLILTFSCAQPKNNLYNDTVSILKDSPYCFKRRKTFQNLQLPSLRLLRLEAWGRQMNFFLKEIIGGQTPKPSRILCKKGWHDQSRKFYRSQKSIDAP